MKFSIITPSFNQAPYLKQTAESVLGQNGHYSLQWIVIDGGSTDGSLDLLRSIKDERLRWTSEKDRGQSDAINRGLARAQGEIVGWLNSDDVYEPDALTHVAQAFEQHPHKHWLAGRCAITDEKGQTIRKWITHYKNHKLDRYTYRRLLTENFISQPGVFFRRSFAEQVGPLDESLHFAMDYDFWLRMGRIEDPIIVRNVLARFRVHGGSKTVYDKRTQFEEDYQVALRYIGDDSRMRWRKRLHVEKIVWAYRFMRMMRR